MTLKLILMLLLVGLSILFIIQNVAIVEIQFLLWSVKLPRSLLMFLLLAIGLIIGWFSHGFVKFHRAKSS